MDGCSFQQVLQQNLGLFFFLTLENAFSSQHKEHRFFLKTVLGIFKKALHLIYRHVFM